MTNLTDEALQAILDGTKGVTPGPWAYSEETCARCEKEGKTSFYLREVPAGMHGPFEIEADVAYIARLDPQTVASLVTELQAYRASAPAATAREAATVGTVAAPERDKQELIARLREFSRGLSGGAWTSALLAAYNPHGVLDISYDAAKAALTADILAAVERLAVPQVEVWQPIEIAPHGEGHPYARPEAGLKNATFVLVWNGYHVGVAWCQEIDGMEPS